MSERIYRAWSPRRGRGTDLVSTDRNGIAGKVGALNQGAGAFGTEPDWRIQVGEATWRDEE